MLIVEEVHNYLCTIGCINDGIVVLDTEDNSFIVNFLDN